MTTISRPDVLIDSDGVSAGFDQEVQRRVRERFPHIPLLDGTRRSFYVSKDYGEYEQEVRALSLEKGFFASLPLIEGVLEGWQRVREYGFEPRMCTSPIRSNPYSKQEKLQWIEAMLVPTLGREVLERAIVTSDKYLCDGIALIDDRPELENAQKASWQHVIFGDGPAYAFNRHVKGPRLRNWRDKNLRSILEQANDRYEKNRQANARG